MDIFQALANGNLNAIKESIAKNKQVLVHIDTHGNSPLHLAIANNLALPTQILIAAGAPLDLQNNVTGSSPLILAVEQGALTTAQMLIDAGADPNIQNNKGETALHITAKKGNPEICKILLDGGANPDIQEINGSTSLIIAAMQSNPDIARTLLAKKANPDIQNKNGQTALHMSAFTLNHELIDILIKAHANPNIKNADGRFASSLAGTEYCRSLISHYSQGWAPSPREPFTPRPQKETPKPEGTASQTFKYLDRLDQILNRHKADAPKDTDGKPRTPGEAASTADVSPSWTFMPPYMLAKSTTLGDVGYRLTEVFNFETRQYISAMQNTLTGYESGTQRSFDEMSDKTLLSQALNEFSKAGGTTDPNVISTGFRARHKETLLTPAVKPASSTPPSQGKGA